MSVGWPQTFALDLEQVRKALAIYALDPATSIQTQSSQLGMGVPKVESLNAWLKYLGLRDPRARQLTPLAELLLRRDPSLTDFGTLCVLHYVLVSNPEATVWYEAVNHFLAQHASFTREVLLAHFQAGGIGQHTPKQLKSDLGLLVQTYTDPNRRALQPLGFFRLEGELIVAESVTALPPLVLGYCLFRRLETGFTESTTAIARLLQEDGCPGWVFRLHSGDLRQKLAELESAGYIAVARMADIDGISYAFQGASLQLLEAYFTSAHGTPVTSR